MIFCGYKSKDVIWFRVLGYGLSIKRTPMLFSERNKYKRTIRLGFGWRLSVLKKKGYK